MPKPPSQRGGVRAGEVGSKMILYIHGGAFAGVSAQLYQYLMAFPLAHHTNCVVLIPEYKFDGASVFPTQLDQMTKLYRCGLPPSCAQHLETMIATKSEGGLVFILRVVLTGSSSSTMGRRTSLLWATRPEAMHALRPSSTLLRMWSHSTGFRHPPVSYFFLHGWIRTSRARPTIVAIGPTLGSLMWSTTPQLLVGARIPTPPEISAMASSRHKGSTPLPGRTHRSYGAGIITLAKVTTGPRNRGARRSARMTRHPSFRLFTTRCPSPLRRRRRLGPPKRALSMRAKNSWLSCAPTVCSYRTVSGATRMIESRGITSRYRAR